MTEHRIVAIAFATSTACARCGPDTPHNVIARCACGQTACGITDHIWSVARRDGELVWLSPSFNWLIDRADPSRGSHVHEFVQGMPLTKQSDWPVRSDSRYELRTVTRDGVPVMELRCPKCEVWAELDDDQYHGRVSLWHDEADGGCGFHETIDLAAT